MTETRGLRRTDISLDMWDQEENYDKVLALPEKKGTLINLKKELASWKKVIVHIIHPSNNGEKQVNRKGKDQRNGEP